MFLLTINCEYKTCQCTEQRTASVSDLSIQTLAFDPIPPTFHPNSQLKRAKAMETEQDDFHHKFVFWDGNLEKINTENYFAGEHALAEGTEEQDFVTVLPCVVHRFYKT